MMDSDNERPNNGMLNATELWRINSCAFKVREAFETAAIEARDECLWLAAQCRKLSDDNDKLRLQVEQLTKALGRDKPRE